MDSRLRGNDEGVRAGGNVLALDEATVESTILRNEAESHHRPSRHSREGGNPDWLTVRLYPRRSEVMDSRLRGNDG